MMEHFFALILTIQGHSAVLDRAGPYATLEACRAHVAATKAFGAGCISESGLAAVTTTMFNRQPSEIWR